ncbi:ferric reductase-like transmembrane domain-containing protein [Marinobacter salinisoli]|uniref:Ferric reductase-like transmembrane domain-containing protein n=1 Tax=Marinobacter salinisoli TaxID=2769486 RepID=A0ABX7MNP5_9GAMM|nr:ferredoxin reductase family protein [Marinobacter salinisoli]QSP93900.1 ferric reductase-like transmembrane domain-containing protein [Marinobacter salinisoli]
MKPLLLIVAYLVAVTLPLAVSAWVGGPPRAFHQELASGLGILAFSMILIEFVLSGRSKTISRGIGMDVTMRFHQLMARTALVFALLHPFLYLGTPSGGQRPWDPTRALTITTDFSALSTGIAAYLLLPSLVLLAIGRTQLGYKYETWRLLHGIGALLIALLLLHHTVYAGRYGSEPVMTWVWLALTGLAAGSLLKVYLVVPLLQKARPWRVSSVVQLTPRQWEVTVTPDGHQGLAFKAGQFVWLNVGHNTFSMKENPFSICSAPAAGPEISFMVKERGDFTCSIGQIEAGTTAYLDGPYGNLSVDNRPEPGIALIAGGVGLAPLLSILRQLRLSGDSRKVKVFYGNRAVEQIAYREELGSEDVVYVLSEPPEAWQGEAGFIDGALMDRIFSEQEFGEWVFVMCGPAAMMDAVEDHLIERGTPSHRILSERFDYD